MQTIPRKDAISANLGQYFTGKPCKYGHIAHRYTKSGACSECVSLAAASAREETRDVTPRPGARTRAAEQRQELRDSFLASKAERIEAFKRVVEIRVPVHPQDLETVFETACVLCLAAFPCLERVDVLAEAVPARGTPLYSVPVPVDQVELVRSIANELWNVKGPNLAVVHDRVARTVATQADAAADEPPENWS